MRKLSQFLQVFVGKYDGVDEVDEVGVVVEKQKTCDFVVRNLYAFHY